MCLHARTQKHTRARRSVLIREPAPRIRDWIETGSSIKLLINVLSLLKYRIAQRGQFLAGGNDRERGNARVFDAPRELLSIRRLVVDRGVSRRRHERRRAH